MLFRAFINSPDHWRDRAEEARAIAGELRGAEPQRIMLEVAAGYDRLAELAERQLAVAPDSAGRVRVEQAGHHALDHLGDVA